MCSVVRYIYLKYFFSIVAIIKRGIFVYSLTLWYYTELCFPTWECFQNALGRLRVAPGSRNNHLQILLTSNFKLITYRKSSLYVFSAVSLSICLRESRSLCLRGAFSQLVLSTSVNWKKNMRKQNYRNREMEHVRFLQLAERTNSNAPQAIAWINRNAVMDTRIVEMGGMRKIVST